MLALSICRERRNKVKSPAKLSWLRPAPVPSLSQSGNGMAELAPSLLRISAMKYQRGENGNVPPVGNNYFCCIFKKT